MSRLVDEMKSTVRKVFKDPKGILYFEALVLFAVITCVLEFSEFAKNIPRVYKFIPLILCFIMSRALSGLIRYYSQMEDEDE